MYAICLEHPRKRHLITFFGRAQFSGHLAERMTHWVPIKTRCQTSGQKETVNRFAKYLYRPSTLFAPIGCQFGSAWNHTQLAESCWSLLRLRSIQFAIEFREKKTRLPNTYSMRPNHVRVCLCVCMSNSNNTAFDISRVHFAEYPQKFERKMKKK